MSGYMKGYEAGLRDAANSVSSVAEQFDVPGDVSVRWVGRQFQLIARRFEQRAATAKSIRIASETDGDAA